MKKISTADHVSMAACIGPEDLRCGDFIAVLNTVVEFPSFFWFSSSDPPNREEPVRMRCFPPHSGTPLKVKAICLPFIFVKSPHGQWETIDIRQSQIVRLDEAYAAVVWKNVRKKRSRVVASPPCTS